MISTCLDGNVGCGVDGAEAHVAHRRAKPPDAALIADKEECVQSLLTLPIRALPYTSCRYQVAHRFQCPSETTSTASATARRARSVAAGCVMMPVEIDPVGDTR